MAELSGLFEWDPKNAELHFNKHGLSFEIATMIFDDPLAIEYRTKVLDHGRYRHLTIGKVGDAILTMIHVEREGRTRIISCRTAGNGERRSYHQSPTPP